MAFYKKFSEHRHGRDKAKERVKGYQSGGVVQGPWTRQSQYLNNLRGQQGMASGRISPREGNVQNGPGLGRQSGEPTYGVGKRMLERIKSDDMPMKRGGRVTGGADSGVGRLQLSKRLRKQK